MRQALIGDRREAEIEKLQMAQSLQAFQSRIRDFGRVEGQLCFEHAELANMNQPRIRGCRAAQVQAGELLFFNSPK